MYFYLDLPCVYCPTFRIHNVCLGTYCKAHVLFIWEGTHVLYIRPQGFVAFIPFLFFFVEFHGTDRPFQFRCMAPADLPRVHRHSETHALYTCIYIYIYIYVSVCVCFLCMHIHIYSACVYLSACIFAAFHDHVLGCCTCSVAKRMYMYVYIYIYVYIYMFIRVPPNFALAHVHAYACVVCVYSCTCMYIYIYIHAYACVVCIYGFDAWLPRTYMTAHQKI